MNIIYIFLIKRENFINYYEQLEKDVNNHFLSNYMSIIVGQRYGKKNTHFKLKSVI